MNRKTDYNRPLSPDVYADIKNFIFSNIDEFKSRAFADRNALYLTVAISDNGAAWNYQTGDNSFMGNAYGLPYWAVVTVDSDSDPLNLYTEIVDQLEEFFE